jgi:DNA repair protein RecO (recombination protein O)
MEWQDQGLLLSVRKHGESSAIIEVLTQSHGRHAGLVRGGGGRKLSALLQAGTQLSLTWRARLEDQLGSFNVELISSRSSMLLSHRKILFAFNALAAVLSRYLPEREPNGPLYLGCMDLLDRMKLDQYWEHRFCRFELDLLDSIGYGIDLSECAVTAQTSDLLYVSPKSGRAVSKSAAKGYEARLLAYPAFLQLPSYSAISDAEFASALRLTGYFFAKRVPVTPPGLPAARQRLLDIVER